MPAPWNITCNRMSRDMLQDVSGETSSYLLLCSLDLARFYTLSSRPSAAALVRFCGNGQLCTPSGAIMRPFVTSNRRSRDLLQLATGVANSGAVHVTDPNKQGSLRPTASPAGDASQAAFRGPVRFVPNLTF